MAQEPDFWVSTPQIENIHLQTYINIYVHWSIIHSGQDMETSKVSFTWIKKMWDIYMEYLLNYKKR